MNLDSELRTYAADRAAAEGRVHPSAAELAAYVAAGSAAPDLLDHLALCRACCHEVLALKRWREPAVSSPPSDGTELAWRQLRRRLSSEAALPAPRLAAPRPRRRAWLSLAAILGSVLLSFGFGFGLASGNTGKPIVSPQLVELVPDDFERRRGSPPETELVTLSQSGSPWLHLSLYPPVSAPEGEYELAILDSSGRRLLTSKVSTSDQQFIVVLAPFELFEAGEYTVELNQDSRLIHVYRLRVLVEGSD